MTKARDLSDVVSNAAWTSYTPTFSGFTAGNAVIDAKYKQIGKTVTGRANVKLGSTSSVTGTIAISLPVTSSVTTNFAYKGNILDAGVSYYIPHFVFEGTRLAIFAINTAGTYAQFANTSSTVPITWGTNDEFFVVFTYEAA